MDFLHTPESGWVVAAVAIAGHVSTLYRFLKGAIQVSTNLSAVISNGIRFCLLAYQVEQIETSATKTDEQKRAEVLPLLDQALPLIDAGAGLPAGSVERYLTPEVLGALYDGAVFAEQVVESVAAKAAPTPGRAPAA